MKLTLNELIAGRVVYICDYRYSTKLMKAVRKIKPIPVMVFKNTIITHAVNSDVYFRLIDDNNKLTSKIIKPFDNYMEMGLEGEEVAVFDNMKECEFHYLQQLYQIEKDLTIEESRIGDRILLICDEIRSVSNKILNT